MHVLFLILSLVASEDIDMEDVEDLVPEGMTDPDNLDLDLADMTWHGGSKSAFVDSLLLRNRRYG